MTANWESVEGTGWIAIPDFGEINPRRDDVEGGRQYFDGRTDDGRVVKAAGDSITGGPETWFFELDQPFLISNQEGSTLELMISLLEGGRYALKYRAGIWPGGESGGW